MEQFQISDEAFRRNSLRTFQAVFRRPLSKASASFRQASRAKSMSASEVDQPRLSRTAPWASSLPTPMAARTWTADLARRAGDPEDTAYAEIEAKTAVSASGREVVNRCIGNRGARLRNTRTRVFSTAFNSLALAGRAASPANAPCGRPPRRTLDSCDVFGAARRPSS